MRVGTVSENCTKRAFILQDDLDILLLEVAPSFRRVEMQQYTRRILYS